MPARSLYLDLARQGLVMPIGTDLVLHEHDDPDAILLDGQRLGAVVEASARRWQTPLAVPLMDLRVEKAAMLGAMGVPEADVDSYHFDAVPDAATVGDVPRQIATSPTVRITATCDAIRHVASHGDLVAMGMCIGPFSLMTKLVADPITPVFLAGSGMTAEDEPEVAMVERVLDLATEVVLAYVKLQLDAGAKAMIVCEPAANVHYLSPKQLETTPELFDRCVMDRNRRLRQLLADHEADLIFHDCGELTDDMVRTFGTLDPAMLSLGSSRVLWKDAALLPKDVVLYGNLPSKQFYSDDVITREEVVDRGRELQQRMADAGHPFILGTECDVLSVTGSESTIRGKVDALMTCGCAV